MARPHHIWHLVYEGCQSLDAVGPFEVFAGANLAANQHFAPGPRYEQKLVSIDGASVTTESGLELVTTPIDELKGRPDTLLIAGGFGVFDAFTEPAIIEWLKETGALVPRLVTVCTGTFLAAQAGLLDGQRVATHWARARRLQEQFPELDVDADALFLESGDVWTSAGVTAGMDLALALVERDHSPKVAQVVARWLVLHLRRPGGQSQFAAPVWFEPSRIDAVRHAQQIIAGDPTADLSANKLAASVGISARHLTRLFQAELGVTPARYVERIRVERARDLLDHSSHSVAQIARQSGFKTAETMRRAFHRRLGTSPDDYRQRFALSNHSPDPETSHS